MPMRPAGKNLASLLLFLAAAASYATVHAQTAIPQTPPKVDANGTLYISSLNIPLSEYLSPEARAAVRFRLLNPQPAPDPDIHVQRQNTATFLAPLLAKQQARYPVDIVPERIAGIDTFVITPKTGVPAANKKRILINLHGGGFSGCAPICGLIESVPIAGSGGYKIVSIQYRQGPEYHFPAASEDVAAVYRELLKTYKPNEIGIFGCSAGGMLTGQSMAWFQTHGLPLPAAIGIFCAGISGFGGDASYAAFPLDGMNSPRPLPDGETALVPLWSSMAYYEGANIGDPLITPASDPALLAHFPPTLLISGSRSFDVSDLMETDRLLTRAGVETHLHIWDGLYHGYFYDSDLPESRETYAVTVDFFKAHLK